MIEFQNKKDWSSFNLFKIGETNSLGSDKLLFQFLQTKFHFSPLFEKENIPVKTANP